MLLENLVTSSNIFNHLIADILSKTFDVLSVFSDKNNNQLFIFS